MAGTLGVATVIYLPYALFNIINPIMGMIMGFTKFAVKRIEPKDLEKTEK